MSLSEKKGWAVYRSLDVSYVFVVFGGYIGAEGVFFPCFFFLFLFFFSGAIVEKVKKISLSRLCSPPRPISLV